MQGELDAAKTGLEIHILGVNGAGHEGDNTLMTDGRDIPRLQDTEEAAVWDLWNITHRVVVILDGGHITVAVSNRARPQRGYADN